VVRSALGGNCRIRSYNKFAAAGSLKPVRGRNPNPFYYLPNVKPPLISEKARLNVVDLKKAYEYDLKERKREDRLSSSENEIQS